MDINLFDPIPILKQKGHWPVPWTSAMGLVPVLKEHGENLVGCEIGCCFATNMVYFLENLPNLTKLYGIDNYGEYQDGPNNFVSQEQNTAVLNVFLENIEPFKDRVEFIRDTADNAKDLIPDNSLDYIFIDGDHSYEAVSSDIKNYYSKVKSGGIFAGHDFSWYKDQVQTAVLEFMKEHNIPISELKLCAHDTWYLMKP
jgi:hypothetical protein